MQRVMKGLVSVSVPIIGFGEGSCACDPASWWQSVANAKGDEGACVGEGGCIPGSLAFQQHINSICRYLSPVFVAGIGFGEGACACDPVAEYIVLFSVLPFLSVPSSIYTVIY